MKRLFIKGFSLAEVLIVLSVIGILSTITLRSILSKGAAYDKLYYTAYNTLVQAVGNAKLQWNPATDRCPSLENIATSGFYASSQCWEMYTTPIPELGNNTVESVPERGGIVGYPRQYPGFLYGDPAVGDMEGTGENDRAFCRNIVANINTVDSAKECQSFISSFNRRANFAEGDDFSRVFCAMQATGDRNTEGAYEEIDCSGTGNIKPSFTAANGQKFYISTMLATNPSGITPNDEVALHRRLMFRLIVVDLNGEKGPNTQIKKSGKAPDLVLFLVNPSGNIIPIGRPEFDMEYLRARVLFPKFLNRIDPANPTRFMTNSLLNSDNMSFFKAKATAWAGTAAQGMFFNQNYIASQPFSITTMLYQMAIKCAPNGCEGVQVRNTGGDAAGAEVHADLLFINLIKQFMFDTNGNLIINEEVMNEHRARVDEEHGCTENVSPCSVEVFDPN